MQLEDKSSSYILHSVGMITFKISDNFRLGLNGFSNPMRDPKTEEFKVNDKVSGGVCVCLLKKPSKDLGQVLGYWAVG